MPDNNQNPIQSAPPANGSGSGNEVVASQTQAQEQEQEQEQQSRAAGAPDGQSGDAPKSSTARTGRKSSSSEARR
jgi:hypothetical protein